ARPPLLPPGFPARRPVIPERRHVIPARRPVIPDRRPVIPERRPVFPERRPVFPERAKRVEGSRAWPVPLERYDAANDLDSIESDTDFGDDDITIPEALPDLVPSWAPADIGQALISEWEASADTRAAHPSRVATAA